VGKTSLGKSIARALGREFLRISLGGVKDEAEIRGHRRTYVGAMPGKIIQGLKQVKSKNPIFVLDEIDKLGNDFRGDPSSALLEVLDPEQNNTFRDHYLNLPFDLSNVMFLATANVLDTIPPALRDRMEIIQLSGYTEDEKLKISKQYLLTKQIKENGITEKNIDLTDEGLKYLIEHHTREAGLRNLERQIGTVCRKVARKVAEGETHKVKVTADMVAKLLGPPLYVREDVQDRDEVGISTGLAWTQAGGEILYIETSLSKGKGGIILTGQMGDVMKESATTAMSYIRGNADRYGIDEKSYSEHDLHVHIPAGAIPKDGPSAGIAMATAIVSKLSGVPVRKDIAMTGELTLTGKVLPIGGLKEKALAAMRQGITKIIIPYKNVKDLEDIAEEYRDKLEFLPVKHVDEVLQFALVKGLSATTPTRTKKTSGSGGGSRRDRMSASDRVA
jgi:ATP-dependent Lon protease